MATIYRDLRGDLYAVLSDGRNFYATYYGRTQPNPQVWEPDSSHEEMERVCECSDTDAFLLRETGDLGDIQQTRRSTAPRSYLAARALEMIEAWGLDPTHPISRFVRGSSERIPEGPIAPEEADLRRLSDEVETLTKALLEEQERADDWQRDAVHHEEEVLALRSEVESLGVERDTWQHRCRDLHSALSLGYLREALGLGRR